ncbi:MAG: hypothetical protein JSU59_11290 [Nitrospirota bacterium]|nr:MAG: hypothetical protein JSU59_11290 [Nitrospirota bacterium]
MDSNSLWGEKFLHLEMEEKTKKKVIREWIILALCVGLGAHVTLGMVLHGQEGWSGATFALYGILISVSLYVLVQLGRSVWWWLRVERSAE